MILPYDRRAAVAYAHRWAYGRNPAFYDYSSIGGDCTNFVSQCILAGGGIMNDEPTYGWYYFSADRKAPAWTGVPYFANFMLRREQSTGPFCRLCSREELEAGDVIQLSFDGLAVQHSLLVVRVIGTVWNRMILVAAHSDNADHRPLETYPYRLARFLHVEGIRTPNSRPITGLQ